MLTVLAIRLMAALTLTRDTLSARLDRADSEEGAGMIEWLLIIGFIVVAFTTVAAAVTGLLGRLTNAIH